MAARFTLSTGIFLTLTSVACTPTIEPPSAQAHTTPLPVSDVFVCVQQEEPKFPGGKGALGKFVEKNLTYPEAARKANVTGRVFTSFVIGTDGQISDIQVLKGLGFGCDEEAIRLVRAMPRWTPGTQSDRVVRVKFQMPFSFGVAARY